MKKTVFTLLGLCFAIVIITTKKYFQPTHTTLNKTHYIYNTKKQPTCNKTF